MSKATKRIWYNSEVEYIGARGVDTVREMAELAIESGTIIDVFDMPEDTTIEDMEAKLSWYGVEAVAVPISHFDRERWDSGVVRTIPLDASPGRGFVKVLGVGL